MAAEGGDRTARILSRSDMIEARWYQYLDAKAIREQQRAA